LAKGHSPFELLGALTTCPVPWRREARPPVGGCLRHGDSQPGYDRPRGEGADSCRLSGATYRQRYAVSAAQQQGIDALLACRTAQLGGQAERGPQCGFER
jgi:hypothetical protein